MKTLLAPICKKDQIRTLKSLLVSLTFLLLIGCAPRPSFHFSLSKAGFAHQGHAQAESNLHKTDALMTNPNDSIVEDMSLAATGLRKDTTFGASITILPPSESVNVETRYTEKSLSGVKVSVTPFHKAGKKKGISKATGEKPVHPSSWLSFALTIGGLVLFLITLVASAPLFPFALSWISFLIALIPSRNAISNIKRNPEQFSGKGLAQVSFFISVVMNIVMFILFIAFIILLASALAGLRFSIILV